MAKSISCNCGWHEHGTEKELVEVFVQHAQEGHGKQVSREQAASLIREE
jgi:predicted small metal-binding protein